VVATPIGNLEDVTLRALRILREVSLVASEDTRRTARLLQHYSITTPTTSLHEHNEGQKSPALIARLLGGESIALVSDAGTPLISDPGVRFVSSAREAGVRVEPIPGASAVMAAIAVAGFDSDGFVFVGFPPSRAIARKTWLEGLAGESRMLVMFEAPHRIRESLVSAREVFGKDRMVAIGRELTKAHETVVVGALGELLFGDIPEKGEFTIVVAPGKAPERSIDSFEPQFLIDKIGEVTNKLGVRGREAARLVAKELGLPANEVYKAILDAEKSGK
jgi:16S rRNA (cytidine1402-2'-O)-methyltransferase